MMNVGVHKGIEIDRLMSHRQPKVRYFTPSAVGMYNALIHPHQSRLHLLQLVLEIGAYVGYSTLRLARKLQEMHDPSSSVGPGSSRGRQGQGGRRLARI